MAEPCPESSCRMIHRTSPRTRHGTRLSQLSRIKHIGNLTNSVPDPNEIQGRLRRLLSPVEAADYLGLGSRFAIYRLVSSGPLPAVRLANKLRIDLRDLDGTIQQAKDVMSGPDAHRSGGPRRSRIVPRELAPLRHRKKSVTSW